MRFKQRRLNLMAVSYRPGLCNFEEVDMGCCSRFFRNAPKTPKREALDYIDGVVKAKVALSKCAFVTRVSASVIVILAGVASIVYDKIFVWDAFKSDYNKSSCGKDFPGFTCRKSSYHVRSVPTSPSLSASFATLGQPHEYCFCEKPDPKFNVTSYCAQQLDSCPISAWTAVGAVVVASGVIMAIGFVALGWWNKRTLMTKSVKDVLTPDQMTQLRWHAERVGVIYSDSDALSEVRAKFSSKVELSNSGQIEMNQGNEISSRLLSPGLGSDSV